MLENLYEREKFLIGWRRKEILFFVVFSVLLVSRLDWSFLKCEMLADFRMLVFYNSKDNFGSPVLEEKHVLKNVSVQM